MKLRLLFALTLMVILPLGFLSWFGYRAAGEEYGRFQLTVQNLLRSKLSEVDTQIAQLLEEKRTALRRKTDKGEWAGDDYFRLPREDPFIVQCFSQASDGHLLLPSPHSTLTETERAFLTRIQGMFDQKILLTQKSEKTPVSSSMPQSWSYQRGSAPEDGWHPWFWDNDIHLLYWRRTPAHGVIGAEISRIRLLADIIGMLPDSRGGTPPAGTPAAGVPATGTPAAESHFSDPLLASGALILVDSQNRPLYRWGAPNLQAQPLLSLPLSPPLRSWSLQFLAPPEFSRRNSKGGIFLQIVSAILGVGIALFCLAFFLYREHMKDLLEAEQRVSFVNQVSHELKTPLTNIRMYAELLEGNLPEDDEENRKKLDVIILESRRLSRLIGNVLTFSKHRKGKVTMKPRSGIPDQVIAGVIDSFQPMVQAKGIRITTDLHAPDPFAHDTDLFEQILGNLISNVEKYAASGKELVIKSEFSENRLRVWVRDFGPGIPAEKRALVFQPFTRLSDKVNEGVSGTGIGLSIARDLARLHQGDLELVFSNEPLTKDPGVPSPELGSGCCFLLSLAPLPTEKESADESPDRRG